MRKIFACLGLLLLCSGCVAVSPWPYYGACWRMVYENGPSGDRISGDKDALVSAALDGREIRVRLTGSSLQAECIKPAACVWVKDNEVYAQTFPVLSSAFDGRALAFEADSSFYGIDNVATTGAVDAVKWRADDASQKPCGGPQRRKCGVKWYVR